LYQKIATAKNGNVIMSPLSIQSATSLAYFGTSGKTEQEMKAAMHYNELSRNQIADSFADLQGKIKETTGLNIANKIFLNNGFSVKPSFQEVATKSFESKTETVNFGESKKAAKFINDWVESKTNDKIKDLINPESLSSNTKMVLVNAIYFKGVWVNPFDEKDTKKSKFFLNDQDTVDTDFMFTDEFFQYGKIRSLGASVLELPYEDTDFSLMIILPDSRTGLSRLETRLNEIDLEEVSSNLLTHKTRLYLPKFKIECEVDLKEVLTNLVMGRMFSDNAEFTELLETSGAMKISKAIHKAFIEVDEVGTEAAATTAFEIEDRVFYIPKYKAEFKADHPFLFVLRSKSQTIFMGRFVAPI
jgi:serpin B